MGPDATAMVSKFSFYSAVLAASVLAPGLCIVTTAVIALLHLHHPADLWPFVVAQTKDLSTPLAVVVGLNFLSLSFIAGYLFRELSFWLVGLLERVPRFAPLDAPALRRRVEAICGRQALDDCLRTHPQLAFYLRDPTPTPQGEAVIHGGGHRENRGLFAFEYCKRRLRLESPTLSVDNTEAEVNVLTSCLFPVLFVTAELVWAGALPIAVDVLSVVACTGAWLGILVSLRRLRRTERVAAVTHLVYSSEVLPIPTPGPTAS